MANKAKKSVVKYASFEIRGITGTESSTVRIYGRNSNDTIVEVNVEIDDWSFPILIRQMKQIAKDKLKRAEDRLDNINKAASE